VLDRWTPEIAALVRDHLVNILSGVVSCSDWKREAARRTDGIPVYADLGGVITLSLLGDFVLYDPESETVSPVQEELWRNVALASLARHYPDLRGLLPPRPDEAALCPTCSGSGWTMEGRLFCTVCRGRGWTGKSGKSETLYARPLD
jgi:hypothetical protein